MPEYTVLTAAAVIVVIALDLRILRTRLLATSDFWLSLAIMFFFQIFVDGWLTKLSSPIVRYDPDQFSGIRVFFDSPIEDFFFGFALILLTLVVWKRLGQRAAGTGEDPAGTTAERPAGTPVERPAGAPGERSAGAPGERSADEVVR